MGSVVNWYEKLGTISQKKSNLLENAPSGIVIFAWVLLSSDTSYV